jgi:hypothetical protein
VAALARRAYDWNGDNFWNDRIGAFYRSVLYGQCGNHDLHSNINSGLHHRDIGLFAN